jgi:hypothetical protein
MDSVFGKSMDELYHFYLMMKMNVEREIMTLMRVTMKTTTSSSPGQGQGKKEMMMMMVWCFILYIGYKSRKIIMIRKHGYFG